jgi:hypothetical protein
MNQQEKRYWLDQPRNVDRLYYGLIVVCVLLVLSDLVYHKHPHFAWEDWFGFNAFLGFAAFFLIVLSGRPLRRILARDEDYYDR